MKNLKTRMEAWYRGQQLNVWHYILSLGDNMTYCKKEFERVCRTSYYYLGYGFGLEA